MAISDTVLCTTISKFSLVKDICFGKKAIKSRRKRNKNKNKNKKTHRKNK